MHACTENRFLNDVTEHEITIIRDDGDDRFIRFKRPGTRNYYFDLITWPGCLCISGDCGTFVFSRVQDMFTFFRTSDSYKKNYPEIKIHINPQYWHEKLLAETTHGGSMQYSQKNFRAAVKDYHENFYDGADETEKNQCWKEIESAVLYYADNEHEAYRAVNDFKYKNFYFQDFYEYSLEEYTFHFIWCLYAIVWGIEKYDSIRM